MPVGPAQRSPHWILSVSLLCVWGLGRLAGCAPTVPPALSTPAAGTIPVTRYPAARTTDEALAYIIHMQSTNEGCELPCWWGIVPGSTTEEEVLQILAPLNFFVKKYTTSADQKYVIQLQAYTNFLAEVEVAGVANARTATRIWVFSSVPDDQTRPYDVSWERYFLPALLERFGAPTQAWVGVGPLSGADSDPVSANALYFYELYVYYDSAGILVRYSGLTPLGAPDRICLSPAGLKNLRMLIQPPGDVRLSWPPGEPLTDIHPLPEATGLSLEAFYRLALETRDPICVEMRGP